MSDTTPTALRQSIPAIRVRGGLAFLHRQRLLDAGAAVFADGEDEVVVGVSVKVFEAATGCKVLETVV
jgi:hypothetical protein